MDIVCFCNDGYDGVDCSELSNRTLIRLTTVSSSPSPTVTTDSVNITNSTLTTAPYIVTTLPRKVHWTGTSCFIAYSIVFIADGGAKYRTLTLGYSHGCRIFPRLAPAAE